MKNQKLLFSIGKIDDNLINEATQRAKRTRRLSCVKWGTMVASVILIFSISIPYLVNTLREKSSKMPPLNVIFENAYYDLVDMDERDIIKKYNLPNKIKEDMIGDFIGVAVKQKDMREVELFELVLNDTKKHIKAVMIVKMKDGDYTYAIFSGFIHNESNSTYESTSLISVYGIYSSKDIKNIQVIYRDNKEIKGNIISNQETISQFYSILSKATPQNNEQFLSDVFGSKSEKEQQELSIEIADNNSTIKVVTTDNMICYIDYNSFTKYIYWYDYYKLSNDDCVFINKALLDKISDIV